MKTSSRYHQITHHAAASLNWTKYFSFKRLIRPWYCLNFLTYFNLLLKGNHKKIFLTSLDRKELINTYKQADIFLFPSNIECSPVVIFEAMASKTPFLVSNVGNANEIVNISNAGYILPSKIDKNGYAKINNYMPESLFSLVYFVCYLLHIV